jgi:hypothetical protein
VKVYLECWYNEHAQILGNLNGQRVWEGKNYKRTFWYHDLKTGYYGANFRRVKFFRITNEKGDILEIFENHHFSVDKAA